ncbi:MAG: Na+/H+ antiporter subunit E [Chloroflexota bacterium]|nr:Na+/H+ antiporter subunit E [Chloroflexota bacterium]
MRPYESRHPRGGGQTHYGRWASLGIQIAVLLAFWLLLSGRYATPYLVMGVLSVVMVLLLNRDVFRLQPASERESTIGAVLVTGWRWLAYVAWLLYSIVVANVQVAYLVLHPRMPIDPVLLRFKASWLRDTAQVVLANSFTLTPGTVTVDLRDGQYTVHTLAQSLARPLASGEMQKRVASVFGEEARETLAATWVRSVGALEP